MAISMTIFLRGCANVPRQYVRMAEPCTTLIALTAHPEMYRGKVVRLGGATIEEEVKG
jgi:starvation-inducible outer membrane lipoprotein